jgi:hypothetical protein
MCPFCGLRGWLMEGYKTIRCMKNGIKWRWYECPNHHDWGHQQIK